MTCPPSSQVVLVLGGLSAQPEARAWPLWAAAGGRPSHGQCTGKVPSSSMKHIELHSDLEKQMRECHCQQKIWGRGCLKQDHCEDPVSCENVLPSFRQCSVDSDPEGAGREEGLRPGQVIRLACLRVPAVERGRSQRSPGVMLRKSLGTVGGLPQAVWHHSRAACVSLITVVMGICQACWKEAWGPAVAPLERVQAQPFSCFLCSSLAVVETDISICGAKRRAHGLRRIQDSVVLNYQLLPDGSREHVCVSCSCTKCLLWDPSSEELGCTEHIPCCSLGYSSVGCKFFGK